MTDKDKKEIAVLVVAIMQEHHCPNGINETTARELISFAETWKTCRKVMLVGVISTIVGGVLVALWHGIVTLIKKG